MLQSRHLIKEPFMKTIEIDQLETVCGGSTPTDFCTQGVEAKARNFAGADGRLHLDGARKLISSAQSNGFYRCERNGMRGVLKDQPMTDPASRKISDFLGA